MVGLFLCLYRGSAIHFLLTGLMPYIWIAFFEAWCRLVDKDSLLVLQQTAFTLLLAFHRSAGMFPALLRPTIQSVCMPLCLHWILRSFELMTILSLTGFLHKGFRHFCISVFELPPTFKIIDLEMGREPQAWIGSAKFFMNSSNSTREGTEMTQEN
jgi:hypothetical protein